MSPITIGITMALFGLKFLTNADVIRITKQLVENIDDSELTGKQKHEFVLGELQNFFEEILPMFLDTIIKLAVMDLQNRDGRLKKKIQEKKC